MNRAIFVLLHKYCNALKRNYKLERLQNGETFTTHEAGNSMVPLIHSKQDHILEPATWESVEVGDIVYCKVRGNFYTHLGNFVKSFYIFALEIK